MSDQARIGILLFVWAALLVCPNAIFSYPSYRTGEQESCAQCHPGFMSRGPLHDLHQGNQDMTNNCQLCHGSTGDIPQTFTSGETGGQGCRGCHGIDNGTAFSWGAGLRLHHAMAGVPADIDGNRCADCHTDPPPTPESYLPVYYSRSDVNVKDPCDTQTPEPAGEDHDGDGKGLDNDGDLVYDESDPDCANPTGVGERDRSRPTLSIAPNPAVGRNTNIVYSLPVRTDVRVIVHDMAGRVVLKRRYTGLGPGTLSVEFEGRDDAGGTLPSGVYVVRIQSPVASVSGRLLWIK